MRSLVLASIALAAAPLMAQDNTTTARPALISDLNIRANDSQLVAAAKRTVAHRQGVSGQRWVVDDTYLRNATGRVSQSSGTALGANTIGASGGPSAGAASYTAPAVPDPAAAAAKKVDTLKNEQARMHDESLQPYGGDVNEDRVTQRLTQIPGEIQKAQQPAGTTQPQQSYPPNQ